MELSRTNRLPLSKRVLQKLPTWWETYLLGVTKSLQRKCLMVNVPMLSEAWSRDLNLTSRQLQMLGLALERGIQLRQWAYWSLCPRLGESRRLECGLIWTSDRMSTPAAILGGEWWSEISVGWLLWEGPGPSHSGVDNSVLPAVLKYPIYLLGRSWGHITGLRADICVPFEQERNQCTPWVLFFVLKVSFFCLLACFLNQHPLIKEFLSFRDNKDDLSFWKAYFAFEVYVSDINTSF